MVLEKVVGRLCIFCGHLQKSVGGHKSNTDLHSCSRLSKHCTKPAFEDEMCPKRTKPVQYLNTCCLCVDGIDGENILDEEIAAAAVVVGASVVEH